MTTRPRHRSTRPADEPIFTRPDGLDFEKRRIIVPPGFIDLAVLAGGDEYVKVEDLTTIVNTILEEMERLRVEMAQITLHLRKLSGEDITKKDVQ